MNNINKYICCIAILILNACGGGDGNGDSEPARNDVAALGRKIFFDANLSSSKTVSCASCHAISTAFSDPNHAVVSDGAVPGVKATRNSPSIMYSMFSPVFGFSAEEGDYVGGQFHDGSAIDLQEQAKRPLFRNSEMNLSGSEELAARIRSADYLPEFKEVYGEQTLEDPEQVLIAVTDALSIFENSQELRPFSSKYDAWAAGASTLTDQELRGLSLFNAENKGNCAACHPSTAEDSSTRRALFTDFTYDNIGLPANRSANTGSDIGLYGTTGRPADIGRFKVPTLRNVEKTAPYFHSGVMNTLAETVHFYNARDTDGTIAKPEFPANMNKAELGNLGLTSSEEEDIVAFLRTLSDGY